jgi:Ser/Thr protein kinase RdoA (MazF antagonist)
MHWHNEVYAYEHWAGAFDGAAPTLWAACDQPALALVVSELPGQILEDQSFPPARERATWCAAGAALVALHDRGPGARFGRCRRDGAYTEALPVDARDLVAGRLERDMERAVAGEYIDEQELATLRAACELIPAFAGEQPTPCHRDYCAANWLVDAAGAWCGVIDFEFAYWDVRVADFSRDPDWNWIHRPDLIAAFFEGYGRSLTSQEEQQLFVAHAEYALGAILWGRDNAFYGFEREGRESLAHLATLL